VSFLAPLMLLGVVAIAAPIWLHLFGAKRARKVPFAAIDFLFGSDRKVSRSLRVREILLLIARALTFLVVPLLLAKPFVTCQASGPTVVRGPQAAVLIIDDGVASSYRLGDSLLLDRAKRSARKVLDELGPEADAAIFTTSGRLMPTELSRNHLRLRAQIDDVSASAVAGDTLLALRRAAQLLAGSSHASHNIFLFTTRTRAAFAGDGPPWDPDEAPALTVVDVAGKSALDNLAVTAVEVGPDPAAGPRSVWVKAQIRNHGAANVREREARLTIDGKVVARLRFDIEAGGAVEQRSSASLPEGARTATVTVTIDDDALSADDSRFVVAHLREEVKVLLVNGDPRTVRYDDELFYLRAALDPEGAGVSSTEITADDLDTTDLGAVDVVVLANVPALAPERVDKLRAFVAAGGGLLISLGSNTNPDDYNKTMRPLLPQELASVVDVGYGSRGDEIDVKSLHLAKLDAEHPVFKVFGTEGRGLRGAAFRKIVLLGPTADPSTRRVLARYTSGATAVVEAAIGLGRVLLVTSTLDRDWGDLAIQTGYLPFIDKAIRYLAKKQLRAGERDVLVGHPTFIAVQPNDRRIQVSAPEAGSSQVIERERLRNRDQIRFTATEVPGFYSVAATDDSGKKVQRPESTFAVNLDPAVSDLSRLPESRLPTGGHGSTAQGGERHRRVELWHALGAALLLLLGLEGLIVLRG